MSVMTVTGKVKKNELGVVLPHEHLLISLKSLVNPPFDEIKLARFYEPLALNNRYLIYNDPYALYDNAEINDEKVLKKELLMYLNAGGGTLVDVTLDSIGRNPAALKSFSLETGVKIIMGCGEYLGVTHSESVEKLTVRALADNLLKEINFGVGGTGIKPGVIGEIGTSEPITENEIKALDAAALAAVESGLSVHVHTSLWGRNGLFVIERMKKAGLKAEKICINHVDVDLRFDYLEQLLSLGAYVEFDNFGKEFYVEKRKGSIINGRFAYDLERAEMIRRLSNHSKHFQQRILISNDICLKSMLTEYGGNGYGHILNTIVPMLRENGFTDAEINGFIKDNPQRFL